MALKDFDKFIDESAEFVTEAATTEAPSQVDWIGVGKEFVKTDKDKEKIEREMKKLKWIDLPTEGSLSLPMMPGMGIKHFIKEFKIPKVDKIAYGGGFGLSVEPSAGYGFYGVQGNYKNGRVKIYVLDTGVTLVPIVSEVFSKTEIN